MSGVAGERLPVLPLTVLAVGAFLALTGEVLPVGVLSAVAADLWVGVGAAGLLVSAYAVVVMVASIPLALLLARLPRRWVLCGLLLGYAITGVGFALAPGYGVAVIARLLGGVVHAGFFAAVFSAAAEVAPVHRRGRAAAWVSLGVTAGLALGVPGGTALAAAVGWRAAFLLLSGLFVLVAAGTLAVLPRGTPEGTAPVDVRPSARRRWTGLIPVGGLIVLLTLGQYTPYTYIDLLLRAGHVPVPATAAVLLLYGLGAAVGAVVAGSFADAAPRRALVAAGIVIAVGVVVLAASPSAPFTAIATGVWGIGFGMLTPLLQTIALTRAFVDLAAALVNAAFNAGIAGGALLGAGLLLSGRPWPLAAAGAVLALVALLLVPRTRST